MSTFSGMGGGAGGFGSSEQASGEIDEVNDEWFQTDSFETFKKPANERFEIAKNDGTLTSLEGELTYRAGDYILTGPKGEQYPMNAQKFNELKVDNGDGTCSPMQIKKKAKIANHSGVIKVSWGDLTYTSGLDVIVRHGKDDYGVVKKDIFVLTYDTTNMPADSLG